MFLAKSSRVKLLETKSGNWDTLVAAIQQANSELTVEEITPQMIVDALSVDNTGADAELQSQFNTLQTKYDGIVTERDQLQLQVNNLLGSAAEEPGTISSGSEATASPETLVDFANKNVGDTATIIQAAQKDGFLPTH